jgi:hypothetical protein
MSRTLRFGRTVIHLATEDVARSINEVAAQKALLCANEVRNRALQGMSGEKTGRRYKVPGTKSTYYTASRPGEYPARRFGRLASSIRTIVVSHMMPHVGAITQGIVGTSLLYGAYLEGRLTSRNPGGGRPWLSMSIRAAWPRIIQILSERWDV